MRRIGGKVWFVSRMKPSNVARGMLVDPCLVVVDVLDEGMASGRKYVTKCGGALVIKAVVNGTVVFCVFALSTVVHLLCAYKCECLCSKMIPS